MIPRAFRPRPMKLMVVVGLTALLAGLSVGSGGNDRKLAR